MQNNTKKILINSIASCLLLTSSTALFAENAPVTTAPIETEGAKLIGVINPVDETHTELTPQAVEAVQPVTQQVAPVTPIPANTQVDPVAVATPAPALTISSEAAAESLIQQTNFNFQDAKAEAEKLNIKLAFDKKLEALYTKSPMHFWQSQAEIDAFKTQLTVMALSGINQQYVDWITTLSDDSLSNNIKEVVLTDAMIGYLNFTQQVPKQGSKWLYKTNSYNIAAADDTLLGTWIAAIEQGESNAFIHGLKPQSPQFDKMLSQLQSLLKTPKVTWPKIEIAKSLKPNSTTTQGDNIAFVLNHYGMLDLPPYQKPDEEAKAESEVAGAETPVQAELDNTPGVYNAKLINGIKYFQQSYGLEPDGVIGPRTTEWLNITPEQKISLLALNMQRLRLIPGTVETGIMVNIPDYSLRFFKEGEVILDSKVIVGSPARKTPIMSNSINRVVINPPWSVPTRLAKEDIAPKGIKDPNYFVRNGYSLVELSNGQPISVDDILWENVSADSFPFAIRQSPGSGNSLGRYKFDMPNDQAIYLHDTPNHSLFKKDIRAISSGCIRVNKSTELANLLLNVENWDGDKIAGTVKKGNTTPVNLGSRVPVELYYMTAWVDDGGSTQFRTDIYQYDKVAKNGIKVIPIAEKIL